MQAGAGPGRLAVVGIMQRAADLLGFAQRAEGDTSTTGSTATPPARLSAPAYVSPDTAVTLSDVYRGMQIIGTAVSQLEVVQRRGRVPVEPAHALIRRPSLDLEPSEFYEETTLDLASCGNAYWQKIRGPLTGSLLELRKLAPAEVTVGEDRHTGRLIYAYRGERIPTDDMQHLKLFRRTGYPLGLGPIQAAQTELRGTLEARDYSSTWLSTTDVPTGVLTTEQQLTAEQARTYKSLWRGDGDAADPAGHSIRVLGQGLKYAPLMLKPADVQFLETRKFNRTQLASLLGIPSSLLLAAVEGTSQTYANVEQEWIAFNRFTLMAYLRPIETALTRLLPAGNRARFSVDELLRTDTKTRYEAHEVGLRAGFLTIDEVRGLEGLPPLPASAIPTTPTTTPEDTPA